MRVSIRCYYTVTSFPGQRRKVKRPALRTGIPPSPISKIPNLDYPHGILNKGETRAPAEDLPFLNQSNDLSRSPCHAKISSVIRDIWAGLINLVYPRICLLCRQPLPETENPDPLCPACRQRVHLNRPPFCRQCARPITSFQDIYCRTCQNNNLSFDRAWSATIYDDTMRHLIHLFKYGQKTALRHTWAGILAHFIRCYHVPIRTFDALVPVPLHRSRLRQRGYNQAELLAQLIAQDYAVPVIPHLLIRQRPTKNQARLSPKERWTNLHGAFKIKKSFCMTNKNILIIDDLLTTGATACALASLMKQAGADGVSLLTLAVTPRARTS